MNYRWLNTFITCLCLGNLSSCGLLHNESAVRSLNGAWEFGYAEKLDPQTPPTTLKDNIKVPANWYLQGHEYAGQAWYRRSFPLDLSNNQTIAVLRFSGVDYQANVWVNRQEVGSHEGYFAAFELDITDALKGSDQHSLAVLVDSPLEQDQQSWSLNKRLIKGVLGHHDTRPGGAWSDRGQEHNTGGIWNDVELETSQGVYLDSPKVTPLLTFDAQGELTKAEVEVSGSARYWRGIDKANISVFIYEEDGDRLAGKAELSPIDAKTNQYKQTIALDNANLWWPANRGDQPMYRVEVRATNSSATSLHHRTAPFALRKIDKTPSGEWLINNRRLFLKGTNYISSQWKSEMGDRQYKRDLELMLDANINVVRVHAHLEAKRFYHLADRLGMLVWQDFPLQWGYTDSPEMLQAAKLQTTEMIQQFYNHPSIIAWSLHNEPPWDADWMKWKYPDYDPKQNKQLDLELYQLALSQEDHRYVHDVSRTAEHPWFGWYSATMDKYAKATQQNLITEFGAQALPKKSSLRKIVGRKNLWPKDAASWSIWDYHNFQHKETFEIAKVARPNTTDEFVELTQGYQSELISFAGAAYRRQKYLPVGAIFQFMFVEDWPSMNWGVVDYYRQIKPGYTALKNVYADILAFPQVSSRKMPTGQVSIPLWLANDLWQPAQDVQIRAEFFNTQGQRRVRRWHKTLVASCGADDACQFAKLNFNLAAGAHELVLTTSQNKKFLSKHTVKLTGIKQDYAATRLSTTIVPVLD